MFIRKKGSLIVEAAIILPIFILTLLSLILVIRIIGCEENVMRQYVTESEKSAKEAYAVNAISNIVLESRLKKALEEAEKIKLENLNLVDLGGKVRVSRLTYQVKYPLPEPFGRTLDFGEALLFRNFVGSKGDSPPMPTTELEENKESHVVYIFPRAGEKYHSKGCRIVKAAAILRVLSPSLRKNYKPCKHCKPKDIPDGSKVCCFPSGDVFHSPTCFTVKRYVIEMQKQDAEYRGYTPCSICGG